MNEILVETIVEGGPLSPADVRVALAGKAKTPEMRAVMSWVEYAIGVAREESEVRGVETRVRDEACGAARHLRTLREDLKNFLVSERREESGAELS
jgi:hypothetical protein